MRTRPNLRRALLVSGLLSTIACGASDDGNGDGTTPPPSPDALRLSGIRIVEPASGRFFVAGTDDVIDVAIQVADTEADYVRVNGEQHYPDTDGMVRFRLEPEPGIQTIEARAGFKEVEARDIASFIYGDFATESRAHLAQLRLDAEALDPIALLASEVIESLPADDENFGRTVFQDIATCDQVEIRSIQFSDAFLSLHIDGDRLVGDIALDDNPTTRLTVDVAASDCALGQSPEFKIYYDKASLGVAMTAHTTASDRAEIAFLDVKATLENQDVEGNLIARIAEALVREGRIEGILENAILEAGPAISERLSELYGVHEVLTSTTGPEDVSLRVRLNAPREESMIAPEGMHLDLDTAWLLAPEEALVESPGYFEQPVPTPVAAPAADVGISVPLDLINEVVHGLWARHMLEFELPVADFEDFLGDSVKALQNPTLHIRFGLPPVVRPSDDARLPLRLELGDLELSLYGATDGDEATHQVSYRMAGATTLGVRFDDEARTLKLIAGELELFHAPQRLDGDIALIDDLDDTIDLIALVFPTIVQRASFDLPSIGDLPIPLGELDALTEDAQLKFLANFSDDDE